jgi:hypothetical protein
MRIYNGPKLSPNIILNDDCLTAKVKDFNGLLQKATTYFSINQNEYGEIKYDILLKKLGNFRLPKDPPSSIFNDRPEKKYNRSVHNRSLYSRQPYPSNEKKVI